MCVYIYVNIKNGLVFKHKAPVKGFNLVACMIDRLLALAAVDIVQVGGVFQLRAQKGVAAFRGVLRYSMFGPIEGVHAHWASHSSSETSSGGTVRVLLARMLLMLVNERRLAIPTRLTPVPSRFTWARCMCFKNLRPEEKEKNVKWLFSLIREDYICLLWWGGDFKIWPHRGLWFACGWD